MCIKSLIRYWLGDYHTSISISLPAKLFFVSHHSPVHQTWAKWTIVNISFHQGLIPNSALLPWVGSIWGNFDDYMSNIFKKGSMSNKVNIETHVSSVVTQTMELLMWLTQICDTEELQNGPITMNIPIAGDIAWRFDDLFTVFFTVVSTEQTRCEVGDVLKITSPPSGYIASVSTRETGCGGESSPWLIEAPHGRNIVIKLLDFVPASAEEHTSSVCLMYAMIKVSNRICTKTLVPPLWFSGCSTLPLVVVCRPQWFALMRAMNTRGRW